MDYIHLLKTRIDEHPQFSWQKKLEIKRGEFIKFTGTVDTNFYFILSGCLRAFLEKDGEEQIIRFGYAGDFFGALDSFIHEKSSPLGLQAMRKSTILVISKKQFLDFIEADYFGEEQSQLTAPISNAELWSELRNNFILGLMEREMDLLTSSPAQRYQRVLTRSPHLFQLVPAKYIANYLRMSPETLSRLRK